MNGALISESGKTCTRSTMYKLVGFFIALFLVEVEDITEEVFKERDVRVMVCSA